MITLLVNAVVFALIGAVLYNLDLSFGLGLYRRYYNATHSQPMPEGERKGFIVHQSSRTRLFTAIVAALALLVLAHLVGIGGASLIFWTVVWVASIVAGFYMGPFVYEKWRKKNKVLDYLDEVDAGTADPLQDLKTGATNVGKRIGRGMGEFAASSVLAEKKIVPPPPAATATATMAANPPESTPPAENPRETVKRFTRG